MTIDPTPLADAFRSLLEAAATVADADGAAPVPPTGEWDADQILAHVVLVNAATIGAVVAVTSGAVTTYDNRLAQDTWTIARVVTLAGGTEGLHARVRAQGEALCALMGPALSEAELDTPVPALLLSHGSALLHRPIRLRDILTGLAEVELPGHTAQILALRPDRRPPGQSPGDPPTVHDRRSADGRERHRSRRPASQASDSGYR